MFISSCLFILSLSLKAHFALYVCMLIILLLRAGFIESASSTLIMFTYLFIFFFFKSKMQTSTLVV